MRSEPIGGGAKKVLYTLETVRRIGVGKATKALTSKNTCKACAFGMGGQLGGMTNEAGEFPSVCNKSVQAQSTDIQPAIPDEIFEHPISELRELQPKDIERLGRLNTPIYKAKSDRKYRPIAWNEAIALAADRFKATDPKKTFFYSSGRSSNEAAFVFQLLARFYGTNNVNNCSYYCHQATGVGLGSTIGTGTATVEFADLKLADTIFVIGANPSSNHPRFIHQLKACRERGGQVIVINPAKEPGLVKFAVPKSPKSLLSGGSEIASEYLQPNIGQDIWLFKGIAKGVLEINAQNESFIEKYTSGFSNFYEDIVSVSWNDIELRTGVSKSDIIRISKTYASSENTVFSWGMGMTHHLHGSDNVEYIANLALLRGMIGRRGAGLLPLRGHSNVQGVGTIGVKPVLAEDVIAKIEDYFGIILPDETGMDTMACMKAAASGEIDAAVLMGGNLYAANPNSSWSESSLNSIGFKLCLTTTLNQSHLIGVEDSEMLILPVTARDEEWEPTTQESMFNYVRMSDGGINRLDNVRPETVILADLAEKLLPDLPVNFQIFKKHNSVRAAIAEIVPGMENLKDIDEAKREFHISNRLLHEPVFNKPDGLAQFVVNSQNPPLKKTGCFTLSTIRSEGQFNSIIYEEKDSYRGTDSRWSVLMNKEDIVELGAQNGAKVNLRSSEGEMLSVSVVEFNIPRGNVMAYYPEANILTSTNVDPRSKTPAFKSVSVEIYVN
ncbi:FdhF/YdeP family oxidoreductase [Hirschia baltica]|uniref:Oxidoreductase alpha (Molybdopterin) subunit n=1 Tax=Hirschia baltica (strain ATCC 49814 / DSM 5838 / IFAM 1418) TaxID=582402 RepID=C6XJL1_HIRBI|nr:FdhF/YdeP family oxidoreductase [Hirschia baltica]ACT59306.1 oxidoreductase alpha (molybdopterin) subunit [Hirschia baltica ATCC 49814]